MWDQSIMECAREADEASLARPSVVDGSSQVPARNNQKPIHRPLETAYMHVDSSDFGWGAVLNELKEARGF